MGDTTLGQHFYTSLKDYETYWTGCGNEYYYYKYFCDSIIYIYYINNAGVYTLTIINIKKQQIN